MFHLPSRTNPVPCRHLRGPILLFPIALLSIILTSCGDDPTQPEQIEPFEWPTAAPEAQGFSSAALDTLATRIAAHEFGNISSLLIVRNGDLIYEEYFREMSRGQMHDVYSVTKSIGSALIGIAIEDGVISGLDEKLVDFFPAYTNLPAEENDLFPRADITLEQVLQMRAGFEWDEWSVPYATPQNPMSQMYASDDMFRFSLNRAVTAEPGTRFRYNTGTSMLLAGVIQHSTGMNSRDYAIQKLFGPLDITFFGWDQGPNRVYGLGDGLRMLPRDMAKIGYLYANDGVWQGERILTSEWIGRSWQPYSELPDGRRYGYHWWLVPVDGGEMNQLPFALGWGEQYIVVAADYRLVIVSTAEQYRSGPTHMPELINLIGDAFQSTAP